MRVDVDCDAQAVYVTLAGGQIARTVQLADGVLVDEDADGHPVGLEVLTVDVLPVDELLSRYTLPGHLTASLEALSRSWTPVRLDVA
jgi:uncharacterized protein YuzE